MRIELLPGLTNGIRFPVERRARPTLELLRKTAPDPREVGSAIEAFGLDDPTMGLRDAVEPARPTTFSIRCRTSRADAGKRRWTRSSCRCSTRLSQLAGTRMTPPPWQQGRRSSSCFRHRLRVAFD